MNTLIAISLIVGIAGIFICLGVDSADIAGEWRHVVWPVALIFSVFGLVGIVGAIWNIARLM